jgi:hypothetical protein
MPNAVPSLFPVSPGGSFRVPVQTQVTLVAVAPFGGFGVIVTA